MPSGDKHTHTALSGFLVFPAVQVRGRRLRTRGGEAGEPPAGVSPVWGTDMQPCFVFALKRQK